MNQLIEKIFAEHNALESLDIAWEDFINYALFDKDFGYYQKNKKRVGGIGADFYTAVSLKQKVFSSLIEQSAKTILSTQNLNIDDFTFVEIGAEPNSQIIENSIVFRLNDKIEIPPQAIVISNELLDARPFSRFKFIGNKWQKRILKITRSQNSEYNFSETFRNITSEENAHLQRYFPKACVENFSLDISFDALNLFEKICSQNWQGIFIFADYYRTASELSELPLGTARTYFKHTDSTDITKNVGDSDITFSPCSDTLIDIANNYGFENTQENYQANFFMKYAQEKVRQIIETKETDNLLKRELSELISPVHMGSAFRIISGTRK